VATRHGFDFGLPDLFAARLELEQPIAGALSSFAGLEAGADQVDGAWRPMVGGFAGLRVRF
jgi:hypothetical protein